MRPYLVALPEVKIEPAEFEKIKPSTPMSGLVLETLGPHIFSPRGIVLAEVKTEGYGTQIGIFLERGDMVPFMILEWGCLANILKALLPEKSVRRVKTLLNLRQGVVLRLCNNLEPG